MLKLFISLLFSVQCLLLRAQNDSLLIQPFDLKVEFGIGNKSHLGNLGVSSNFYFSRSISLRGSLGLAIFNYGSVIGSIGPEVTCIHWKQSHLSIGSTWSYIGGLFDIIGDDDSYDHFFYRTSNRQNLKLYMGYSRLLQSGVILTFQAGYSHTIGVPSYSFSGPSTPTDNDIQRIDRGLSSGWMATVSFAGLVRKKDN